MTNFQFILFVIAYIFVGVCTVAGFVVFDYRTSHYPGTIDCYLSWQSDDVSVYIILGIFWPLTLPVTLIVTIISCIFIFIIKAFNWIINSIIEKHK